jgi:hypothetical protein
LNRAKRVGNVRNGRDIGKMVALFTEKGPEISAIWSPARLPVYSYAMSSCIFAVSLESRHDVMSGKAMD